MNDSVVGEMKSSANSVIKNIGETVENIDFALPKFDVKAEALDISDIPGISGLIPPQKKPFTYEIKRKKTTSTLTITCSGEMPSYYGDTAPWSIYKSYENLVIKGDVENIGAYAFVNFTNLKKVTIDASVKTIGYQAFYGCTALTTVNFPDSLEKIHNEAFLNCSSLKKIKIPENVTFMGSAVFRGCPLKSLTVPFTGGGPDNDDKNVTNELGYIFGIREFDDTYSVKSRINSKIIYYVPNTLKTVTITSRLDSYGISNCSSIEKVVFAESVKTTYVPTSFAVNADGLKKITFNSKITSLASSCFRDCSGLVNLSIPKKIKTIGSSAFGNCENLKSVVINENIKTIYESAFHNCSSLSQVEFPNTIFNIYYNSFKNTPWFDSLTDEFCLIGDSILIKYNGTDTDVVVPEGIKSVCGAFYENENIATITFPESLKHIGGKSFFKCFGIEDLYIPDSVEVIEEGALYGLCNLKTLSIPFAGKTRDAKNHTKEATFGYIFKRHYLGCTACGSENVKYVEQKYNENQSFDYTLHSSFNKVTVRGGEIKDYAFYGVAVNNIVLEENVTTIGEYSFSSAKVYKYILNCNITEIPDYAFSSNNNLGTAFVIPESVVRIGKAFVGCNRLSSVSLPSGLKTIDGSFKGCKNLSNITLPESLEEIKGEAFSDCRYITDVCIGKNVKTIDFEAFISDTKINGYECNVNAFNVDEENLYYYSKDGVLYTREGELFFYPMQKTTSVFNIDADIVAINFKTLRNMINVAEYTIDEENTAFSCRDGILYNKDLTRLIKYPSKKSKSYIAPESVVEVSTYAFYGCSPDKVEFTNQKAFFEPLCFEKLNSRELVVGCLEERLDYYFKNYKTTLKKLVLTNQTVSLAEDFAYFWYLDEVIISGDFQKVGKNAFWANRIKTIDLPDSVQRIESGAFCYTHLEEFIVPENIKYIAQNAFANAKLKRVVLNESVLAVAEEVFSKCPDLEIVVIGGAVEEIQAKSFSECPSLKTVVIPDGVKSISEDAFEDSTDNLTIYCNEESYAESYAKENNIKYTTLVLDSIENQIYTGEEIRPYVGASANGKRLSLDTEYTVDYKNNINAGSAKIIARGLGDFKALIAVGKFTILPKEMENIEIISQEAEFDPLAIDFKVDVFLDEIQLIKNVDYELVTETKVCDVGENNIAVCGIGNYSGIENITVNVLPRDIAKTTIKTGKKVVVTDKGKELIKDIDYIETRTKDENGKEITEIKGIGNYDGAVICSENERISISFFDVLIEFIQSLIKMLMM